MARMRRTRQAKLAKATAPAPARIEGLVDSKVAPAHALGAHHPRLGPAPKPGHPRTISTRRTSRAAAKAAETRTPPGSPRVPDITEPPSRNLRKRKSPADGGKSHLQIENLAAPKKPKINEEVTRTFTRTTRSTTTIIKKETPKVVLKIEKKPVKPPKARAPRIARGTNQPTQSSLPITTRPPTEPLAILVFGTGDFAELGLGPQRRCSPVPVINPYLDPNRESAYHVVQFACGGMHTVALTADNKIVTWGVNDNGALGRDTEWDEGEMRDIDDESDDEEVSLNPRESTPEEIDMKHFPAGTRFAQVAASDSCTLALTDTGMVYAWGTFLDPNGNQRFGTDATGRIIKKQETPVLIPELKNIKQIACGDNHALALDKKGVIWAWGSGHKNQLGKRIRTREADNFKPIRVEIFRQKAQYIASGSYHSFALDQNGNVWSWGINGFGQAGDPLSAGEHEAMLPYPRKIAGLGGRGVHTIAAGEHHSAAVTDDGKCLVFGRIDGGQLGVEFTQRQLQDESHILLDERNKPRICIRPTPVTGIGAVADVACNTGHTVFIAKDGTGYATGLGSEGQLGNGREDDAETPQRFKGLHSLYRRRLVLAGAGAGFSIVAARANAS
ncbi:regulator of chromosome condensation 1/beta-lactamase-inhibitor protein II [Thelonectria olida]|uniref:Regulator of chromosome condensation 1/beta-lactamase-inhibitor protein II n=1 Tax=Thelonectria olida TaxID=1576542 RepID=A0A9P8W537_9HYPO|nr:regulator of chromosome condensation 1/beta-lactamase-inhibitor protein II [Thelonectria olida]